MTLDPTAPPTTATDEQELASFGYTQELDRSLRFWTTWAIGFAFISPIVGLYTLVALGATTAGPPWVWTIPIAVVGQLLVAMVYAQLAVRWPIAGGIYQWSRRLVGPKYGWWAGWIYAWALFLTLAGVTYFGGVFLAALVGVDAPSTNQTIGFALIVLAVLTAVNMIGLWALKYTIVIGITCELIASVAIGISLLVFYRQQPFSTLFDTSFVPAGTSFFAAFIAALAFGGWAILGFDACGSVAEETRNARRWVPKAIIFSLIPVGIVEILGALALMLATPNMEAVVNGSVADPVANAVTAGFGSWIEKPFLAVVVIGYMACGIAIQATATRVIYSFARDEMVPGARLWRKVMPFNKLPVYTVALVAVLAALAFTWTKGIATILLFATGAYFIGFLAPVGAFVVQRIRGRWEAPESVYTFGRFGFPIAVIASIWLSLELVNIAWPRDVGGAWWETWAVELGLGICIGIGLLYFVLRRPDRRFTEAAEAMKTQSEIELGIEGVAPGPSPSVTRSDSAES